MLNGVKPARLWHLTGKKHLRSITRDKEEAFKGNQHSLTNKEQLRLLSLLIPCVGALCYVYGRFSPQPEPTMIIRPVNKKVQRDYSKPCQSSEDESSPWQPCPVTTTKPKHVDPEPVPRCPYMEKPKKC